MSDQTEPRWWTAATLADYLEVDKETVYRWARNGDLPYYRIGGQIRFHNRDIAQYLEAQYQPARKR